MGRNRSKSNRLHLVWNKTGGLCAHCGRQASSRKQTVDHYIARSRGGGFDLRNLMPLCKECNQERGNDPIDPVVFYKFASNEIIQQCLDYEKRFIESHRNMEGEIV